ncbi:MAG: Flp pilus assembly complex ATPase component TadA [Candidatus Omnitrophica bacterium]|nr:Flp pilus assembly complex ATPase component TadA [Candidatus Omnitrophota bacterium]
MSAKIITIFSNKGGVGKTFITVNLATALSLAKKKVLLLDLDLQAGQDMARMLNLSPRGSIADVLPQIDNMEGPQALLDFVASHSSGIHFMPVIRNLKQAGHVTPDNIKIFIRKAKESYDYILIDAGCVFHDTTITVFDYSNLILLVATPDILAVYQIKACLDILQNLQFPSKIVKLILNRSESSGSVAWQEIRTVLPCEIFSHIPSDGKIVGLALNRGIPCVLDSPKAKVTDAFIRMANTFEKDASLFVEFTEVEKQRIAEGASSQGRFWETFGISPHISEVTEGSVNKQDDEVITLKKKIHEKLIERLNLEGITPDTLNDPQTAQRVKKSSEQIVSNLLMEELGGKNIASYEDRVRFVKDVVNEALGLGPLEDFLADPDVTDIMANNKNEIYVEKNGRLVLTNKRFLSDSKMRAVIDRIIAPLGRRIDESTPMVDARLPDGSRINAIIPPLSLNGPMITIRKFGQERLTISDLLVRYHSLSDEMATFLQASVVSRKNIIVSGGTGSGKTTFLNVLSEFIPDGERLITIEDAAELKLKKSHWGRLESRPSNVEGKGQVTIRDLFVNCLRMRPDRIVIGECRGPEVLDMLQAMNTGHDGSLTTIHANSTRDVLTRMHSLILLSGVELPVRAINEMIASAIDLIVHVNRFSDGTRKVTGISEIGGLDKDFQPEFQDVFTFTQTGIDANGKVIGNYEPTGHIPKSYSDFITQGLVVDKKIFSKSK